MTTHEYYNFTEQFHVFEVDESEIIMEINILFKYLYDIIHLHVYPFILFIIIRNIENKLFTRFLYNLSFIVFSHICFLSFFTSFSTEHYPYNCSTMSIPKQKLHTDICKDNLAAENSYLFRLYTIVYYIFIVEFLAYGYHRIVHTRYFSYLHSHDFSGTSYYYLLRNKSDIIAQSIYIYYPLLIVPIKYSDFILIYFLYIFIGFLSNTYSFSKIHTDTKKYNYALGIPIFDIIFGTYLSEERYLLIQR